MFAKHQPTKRTARAPWPVAPTATRRQFRPLASELTGPASRKHSSDARTCRDNSAEADACTRACASEPLQLEPPAPHQNHADARVPRPLSARGGFEAPYRRERADLLPSTGNRQPHKRPHGPRIVGAREAGLSALSRAAEADAEVGKVPAQMWVDPGLSPTRACDGGRQRHWTPSWPMRLPPGCTARSSRAGGRAAC